MTEQFGLEVCRSSKKRNHYGLKAVHEMSWKSHDLIKTVLDKKDVNEGMEGQLTKGSKMGELLWYIEQLGWFPEISSPQLKV